MLKALRAFPQSLFLIFCLLPFTALSTSLEAEKSITTYKGQTFPSEQKEACLESARDVAKRMEELGYQVYDETCLKTTFGNQFMVAVNYEYDIMNFIERLETTVSSLDQCYAAKTQALSNFSKISSEVISAFCREISVSQVKLRVDYKKNNTFIRDYNHLDLSSSYNQCVVKKEQLEKLVQDNQIKPVVSLCVPSFDQSYKIELHYSFQKLQSLKTILGKKVESRSACEFSDSLILDNFQRQSLNALMTFCTQKGEQLYKSVLFLEDHFSRVREFKGFSTEELSRCETNLQDAKDNLEESGHAPLYLYCQKSRDSFTPVIHYFQAKSI